MQNLTTTKKQTLQLIAQAQKICCLTGPRNTGDGIMAMLATQKWLTEQGKSVTAVFSGPLPKQFSFVSADHKVTADPFEAGQVQISIAGAGKNPPFEVDADGNVNITVPVKPSDITITEKADAYDLILCFDVSNLSDLGDLYTDQITFFQDTPLVNIAANGANEFYAKLNLVDPTRSSATEVLFDLINQSETKVSPELATTLLTGLIAGTKSFLGEHTTASALSAASQLQELGATQSDIIENLYKKKSLKTLKLWGQIFSRLELDQNHRIARSTLTKTDFEMLEATPDNVENITEDILRFTDGSDFLVLFTEYKGQVSAKIRSRASHIDWEKVALEAPHTPTEAGIDVVFADHHLSDVEKTVFKALVDYQIQNQGLDQDLSVEFKHCVPVGEEKEELASTEAVAVTPQAPESIPFEAPEQPHESDNSWIKKNFPKN